MLRNLILPYLTIFFPRLGVPSDIFVRQITPQIFNTSLLPPRRKKNYKTSRETTRDCAISLPFLRDACKSSANFITALREI